MSPVWGGAEGTEGVFGRVRTHRPGRPLMLANWETNDCARAEMEEEKKREIDTDAEAKERPLSSRWMS